MDNRYTRLMSRLDSVNTSLLTRRQMLRHSLALGAGAVLLAACGDDGGDDAADDQDTDSSDPDTDEEDTAETPSDSGDGAAEETEEPEEEETSDDAADTPEDERSGGELQIALIGEPPSLDIHQTSATVTTHVVMHMYETLFTWNEEFEPIPELVDTHEVSDDGLVNTVNLRQGVPFHNGNELTANDVAASIDRWANDVGVGFGQELMGATEEMRVVDDYTLEFQMTEPFGTFNVVLARQNNGCAIYPQDVVEAAGADPISEFIGTGPYQFIEHQPDRHILLERFEDYAARDEEPQGYGGRKNAYVDSIRFVPVPDEAARVAGLQSGEFHYLEEITTDQFETLEGVENVVAELGPPTGNDLIVCNTDQGMMTDINMRRAVQAAVGCEEILTAAHGEGYYRLDPGHMWQETIWHTTAGEDLYNIGDPDLAASYLEDAGYNGEPIRLITTQEYMDMYNTAVVLEQQLGDAGMTVETQVFDWATLLETRGDTSAWELAITGFSFRVDPTQLPIMRCDWGGMWCTDPKVELTEQLYAQVNLEDRLATWEELQLLIYEEVPLIKTGEGLGLLTYLPSVQNLTLTLLAPAYWNVWLDE